MSQEGEVGVSTTKFQHYLTTVNACAQARTWAGDRNSTEAWRECTNPKWLLWWAWQNRVNHYSMTGTLFDMLISGTTHVDCDVIRRVLKQPWSEEETVCFKS